MRRWTMGWVVLVLLSSATVGDQPEELGWLDLQHCGMCKSMGENMDMMQHVTWENHKISNGVLSASVIPDEYRSRMQALHAKMKATEKRLEAGEKMPLCGYCTSYGKLKAAGAKTEEIKTDFGMIALVTSDDPKVVEKIHAHSDRTVAEFEKFMAAQQPPHSQN